VIKLNFLSALNDLVLLYSDLGAGCPQPSWRPWRFLPSVRLSLADSSPICHNAAPSIDLGLERALLVASSGARPTWSPCLWAGSSVGSFPLRSRVSGPASFHSCTGLPPSTATDCLAPRGKPVGESPFVAKLCASAAPGVPSPTSAQVHRSRCNRIGSLQGSHTPAVQSAWMALRHPARRRGSTGAFCGEHPFQGCIDEVR
jgi:hypothetical protein